MNKTVTFIVIITLFVLYFFNIDRIIKNKISVFNSNLSSKIVDLVLSIEEVFNKYFNQLEYINKLEDLNTINYSYKVKHDVKVNQLNELNRLHKLDYNTTLILKKVKVLSYKTFNDISKVIIEYPVSYNSEKLYPLITYDGFSAGVVVNLDSQNIGFLNNNDKCNYTIFIGKENAPGITSGMTSDGNLIIKYIPLWKTVKIDDEIITSGMDKIFPYGIKVGKVIYITKDELTQTVYTKPYAIITGQRYFYLNDSYK